MPRLVPLRVLLVEDSEVDAELVLEELRRGGYEPAWERVETAVALTGALQRQQWDVITCDWVMPQFSAPAALALLRESQVDVPVIIVSGQVGEEYAVTAMKAGAHDFVNKRNLARLCPAIERELKETEERRAHKRAEEMLRRSEDKFRLIFNSTNDAVCVLDMDGQFLEVNRVMCDHVRYTREELLKLTVRDICTPEFAARVGDRIRKVLQDGYAVFETAHIRRDGTVIPVEVSASTVEYEGKPAILSVDRDITERKQAEEALRQSEERFSSAFKHAAICMALIGLDGRFLRVNQPFCDLAGYSAEELTARTFQEITHPDDVAAHLDHIHQLLAGEIRNYQMEKRYFHKRGHVVWILLSGSLVRDAQGKPLYFIAQIQNITERKRAEEALRRSEERFSSAFEYAAIGMALVGLDGRFLRVNQTLCDLTGHSADELTTKTFQDITHPDDLAADLEYVRQLLAGEIRNYHMEKRYFHKRGHVVWIILSVSLVRDAQGQPLHFISQIQDITERKRVEQALAISEERLRMAMQGTNDGLWDWNIQTGEIYYSPRWKLMLGYTEDELESLDARKRLRLIHPEDRERTLALVRSLMEERAEKYEVEFRLRHKDGRYLDILSRAYLVRDARGEVVRLVGTHVDISERKRAEAELRAASRYARSLIEASLDPLVTISPEGKITDVNQATATVTGCAREQLIGTDFATYFTEPERARAGYELAFSAGIVRDYPLEIRHRDGHVTSVLYNASVYRDEGGQIVGIFAAARDVTERKQVEEREKLAVAALQLLDRPGNVRSLTGELLRLIRSALDLDAAAIRLRQGEDFPYLAQNGFPEAFVRAENSLLARSCDGLIARDAGGQATLECTCGLVVSGRTDPYQPFFTEGGTFWTNDSSVLLELAPEADPRRNPRNRCIHSGYMSFALIPLRHGEQIMGLLQLNDRKKGRFTPGLLQFLEGLGASIGMALSGRQAEEEISRLNADLERRVAERTVQLEVANKELEAFSYSVSHDLRAPLRAVDGFSTMLLDRYGAQFDGQGRHYLQRVREGAQRMDQLINDLLGLSRITRSQMHWKTVDLTALARAITAELQNAQPKRSVEFVITDGVVVEGDAGLLRTAGACQ